MPKLSGVTEVVDQVLPDKEMAKSTAHDWTAFYDFVRSLESVNIKFCSIFAS